MRRLILLCSLIGPCLCAQDSASYPPPGRLFDIGGRRLHLDCTGVGSPTVILVAGGGAYSIDWALVQRRVSDTTRVCSYDRAGLGWSDPGPADETVEETVDDLHRLLAIAKEPGPYLLVGASIGGIYIRAYQHAFPREVAGLVFVNSSHRVGMAVRGKSGLIWDLSEDDLRSSYPLPALTKPPQPTRETEPFDRLPRDLQAARLWLDVRSWQKWDPSTIGPQSMLSWRAEFLRELQESCSGRQHPLGALPVVVVASNASPATLASQNQLGRPYCDRSDASDGLEVLSSNTAYVIAPGSGHEIHLYQPERAAQAIGQAVTAVRYHQRVSSPPA